MNQYWYLMVADAILTLLSVFFGMMLRLEIFFVANSRLILFLRTMWPFVLFAVVLRPAIFYFTGIYRRIWRYGTSGDFNALLGSILLGSIILSAASLLALHFGWISLFPRSLLILEGIISLILLGGLRVILKSITHYQGDIDWSDVKLEPARRVMIAGAGYTGVSIAKEFAANPQLYMQPVAFLDDDRSKNGLDANGIPVFGPLIRLPEVVKDRQIDEVIIAMPSAPAQTIQNLQSMCKSAGVPCSTMPFLSSFMDRMAEPCHSNHLPMALPDITGEEIHAVVRVMQSRNLSIGSQTVAFEKFAAAEANAAHGVAVINGTSGLHLTMVAARVGSGDEVITTPFSFVASANCILYERAVPVFVDIDPVTLNIDPAKIEAKITGRTRAIIPVHVFGQPADMDPILQIAEKYGLPVIEDACEAIGAEYKGRRVGALGKAGVFAFYPNKQITCGEGAMMVTNDEEWAFVLRSLRNQGRDQFDGWLNHSRLGFNYRLSELNAALGVVQIRRLNELLRKRDVVADEYTRCLSGIEGVAPLSIAPTTTRTSWFVYAVRILERVNRNRVIGLLAERGIPSRAYFTPIHLQPFYIKQFGYKLGDFPETEKASSSILALPFYADMKAEEVHKVCNVLREVMDPLLRQ